LLPRISEDGWVILTVLHIKFGCYCHCPYFCINLFMVLFYVL
jgi:hypothetical protein